jgi:hypothetical protein
MADRPLGRHELTRLEADREPSLNDTVIFDVATRSRILFNFPSSCSTGRTKMKAER